MGLQIFSVSREEFDAVMSRYLQVVPIPDEASEQAFYREWLAAHQLVERELSKIGQRDDCAKADFGMLDEWSAVRQIAIGIYSLAMFSREFLECAQGAIAAMEQPFNVHVACEYYGRLPDIGWGQVLVTKDAVYINNSACNLAEAFNCSLAERRAQARR